LIKADVRQLKCAYDKKWVDKISNKEMLAKVEENRQIMKIIQQRQDHCIGYILRHYSLLLAIE